MPQVNSLSDRMVASMRGLAVRYIIVGVTVFIMYYSIAKGLIWAGVPVAAAILISLIVSVSFQYAAHSSFTYRVPVLSYGQIGRFLFTVATGTLLGRLMVFAMPSWVPYPTDVALVASAVTLATINYFVFKLWVFRESL